MTRHRNTDGGDGLDMKGGCGQLGGWARG